MSIPTSLKPVTRRKKTNKHTPDTKTDLSSSWDLCSCPVGSTRRWTQTSCKVAQTAPHAPPERPPAETSPPTEWAPHCCPFLLLLLLQVFLLVLLLFLLHKKKKNAWSGGGSLSSLIAGKRKGRGGLLMGLGIIRRHPPRPITQTGPAKLSCFIDTVCEQLTGIKKNKKKNCVSMTARPGITHGKKGFKALERSRQVKMLVYDCTKIKVTDEFGLIIAGKYRTAILDNKKKAKNNPLQNVKEQNFSSKDTKPGKHPRLDHFSP